MLLLLWELKLAGQERLLLLQWLEQEQERQQLQGQMLELLTAEVQLVATQLRHQACHQGR